ncbi:prolipoprotein diacylglyceryl transferase [Gilvimarinus agarilyticus]|uniref:prolipoprotein diacylglyceryl transferase n=1 Tax=unclassified Gilvimarinus TaxID=2642066 RepID=UPI001C080279|nr:MULTISPECIES: prolipoprotein diacylglyceryl transferase [unclassified Gilvimarinus]MBU2886587.1 prolipoprotein diacylglyceryl transferase [Gilvimarinus agarilyticus]MDO6571255.1 prolipoprotein diacylglyceryl transferase [Gilvimarinus sp. 2_MG-2023]MDO6746370.1 prolipoprotein diacylglyceryl transferase [Gilvimarinus sp. 1_MG-2023]
MLTHPNFDPVAISVGPLDVHWYGIMYLLAFAAAWGVAMHRAGRAGSPITRPQVENLITYGAFGVVLGGRFGYVVFYNFDAWMNDPLWLFRIWEGGMSFHGGFIGVVLAMLFYAHRLHIPYLRLTDFVAPIVPLGLAFGRLGNFIGQELWGRATDLPWAMVFPKDPEQLARHPSQLYQMALEGILLFIIVFWFSKKPRPAGAVSGVFLIGYALFRILVEFAREPDQHIQFDLFGWVTRGQLLSLPLLVLGVGLLVAAYGSHKLMGKAAQGGDK